MGVGSTGAAAASGNVRRYRLLTAGTLSRRSVEVSAAGVAWLLLAVAALALRIFGFRAIAPLLGSQLGPVAFVPLASARQEAAGRLVARAMRRAAHHAWFFRADCLPQAVAGVVFCRLLGVPVTAHLGVRMDQPPSLAAHAWLCCGRVAVTGGRSFGKFSTVLCFAAFGRGKVDGI